MFPTGPFAVIYADPPWNFQVRSNKGKGRSAEAHYDTMSLSEIQALPVESISARDCVLLLWTTDPFLPEALITIACWGFKYKTVGFYWAKSTGIPNIPNLHTEGTFPIGTGYWTRANPEMCLLATRGAPKRLNADVRKLVIAPRREHSRKPDEMYDRIERLCDGPYIELFARTRRPSWESWGLETNSGPAERRWSSSSGTSSPINTTGATIIYGGKR